MASSILDKIAEKEEAQQSNIKCRLFCCASLGCLSSGCQSIMQAFKQACEDRGVADRVQIIPTGCMGPCSLGPMVRVEVRERACWVRNGMCESGSAGSNCAPTEMSGQLTRRLDTYRAMRI